MTIEEKRIKIAETCGYKRDGSLWEGGLMDHELPDYFRSLDAIRSAEQVRFQDLIKNRYWLKLMDEETPVKIEGEDRTELVGHWNSSAAQRAEAFGKTLGLW